jgi:predicted short-subunit dehydrogenase-like oxidoreductase (DUF2520 family)
MQMTSESVGVFIAGSGNVAHRLAAAFAGAAVKLKGIVSKSSRGRRLAEIYGVTLFEEANLLPASGDVVLLCVKDDALTREYFSLFPGSLLLCHTAGSVDIDVFGNRERAGVFYPLQTLSAAREIDFSNVPVCVEALSGEDTALLESLAGKITSDVRVMNSAQRMKTHLAAVFVSNFVNHLYKIAADILEDEGTDAGILKPLIAETAAKVMTMSPEEAQTGPAKRGDKTVLDKHLQLLKDMKDYREIYKLLSESISGKSLF